MEIKLNKVTTVQVSAKTSIFVSEKKKTFMQIRNDKVVGANVSKKIFFCKIRFSLFVILALVGGYAHFMYDTVYLEYNPNLGLITGIILSIILLGFIASVKKKRVLEIFLLGTNATQTITFNLDKTTDKEKLNDLVDIIVS